MGCTYNVPSLKNQKKFDTPVGLLEIEIIGFNPDPKYSAFQSQDKYIHLAVSNQEFQITQEFLISSKKKGVRTTFSCFINSFYKEHGRMLIASIWSSNHDPKLFGEKKAFGIMDVNPFIWQTNDSQKSRCYLNFVNMPAGYIDLRVKFKKLNFFHLLFSITDFHFEKSITGKRLCYCKITAGEEVLETDISAEIGSHRASWKNQVLSFCIPETLRKIEVEILEKCSTSDLLLAEATITLTEVKENLLSSMRLELESEEKSLGYIEVKLMEEQTQSILEVPSKSFKDQNGAYSMKIILDSCENERTTLASENTIFTEKRIEHESESSGTVSIRGSNRSISSSNQREPSKHAKTCKVEAHDCSSKDDDMSNTDSRNFKRANSSFSNVSHISSSGDKQNEDLMSSVIATMPMLKNKRKESFSSKEIEHGFVVSGFGAIPEEDEVNQSNADKDSASRLDLSDKESVVYKVVKKGQRRNSSFLSNQKVVKEGTIFFKKQNGGGKRSPSILLPLDSGDLTLIGNNPH